MLLSGSTVLMLKPTPPPVPLEEVLRVWLNAAFEPGACRRGLEQLLEQRKVTAGYFLPEEIEKGGRAATDILLFEVFANPREWTLLAQTKREQGMLRSGLRLPTESVNWVGQLIRSMGDGQEVAALREAVAAKLPGQFAQVFNACLEPAKDEVSFGAWPVVDAPGIYRREHASLIIRSKTTTLLLDPQLFTWGGGSNLARYPRESGPLDIDAILISHQHEDHWHLPAILRFAARQDMPIIVPSVPRPNLLTTEDFAASLGQVGLKAVPQSWGSTLRVGDIDIDVLPFYGEQPTCGAPGPQDGLRNWGNCYRFTTPDFSALVLVDSGVDPMGNMVDVVRESVAKRGAVDVVLSNFRQFPEAINIGLPEYALTLPFEQLRRIYQEQSTGHSRSMTLGEEGVVAACVAARARYVLPYAHLFKGIGVDVDGDVFTPVRDRLARQGTTTEAVAWNPGDVARFEGRQLQLERSTAPSGR